MVPFVVAQNAINLLTDVRPFRTLNAIFLEVISHPPTRLSRVFSFVFENEETYLSWRVYCFLRLTWKCACKLTCWTLKHFILATVFDMSFLFHFYLSVCYNCYCTRGTILICILQQCFFCPWPCNVSLRNEPSPDYWSRVLSYQRDITVCDKMTNDKANDKLTSLWQVVAHPLLSFWDVMW